MKMSDASPPVRGTGGHCRNHVLSRNGSRRQIASNQIGRRCTGSRARRAPAPARTSAHRHRSRRLQCMPRSMPQALVRPRCAAAVLNVHVQCSACACAATRQLVRLFSSCGMYVVFHGYLHLPLTIHHIPQRYHVIYCLHVVFALWPSCHSVASHRRLLGAWLLLLAIRATRLFGACIVLWWRRRRPRGSRLGLLSLTSKRPPPC